MLIVVEGILSAGNLIGALIKKPELTNPNKLVYSGHIYPFRYSFYKLRNIQLYKYIAFYFSPIISDLPYDLFKLTMHTMQTFVADAGHIFGGSL